ncbi:hypothetical protein QJS66_18235 [Kocuria rhizophila]|nr:hypothetical protein QJS66_18235 [Kocuria rhizophila]
MDERDGAPPSPSCRRRERTPISCPSRPAADQGAAERLRGLHRPAARSLAARLQALQAAENYARELQDETTSTSCTGSLRATTRPAEALSSAGPRPGARGGHSSRGQTAGLRHPRAPSSLLQKYGTDLTPRSPGRQAGPGDGVTQIRRCRCSPGAYCNNPVLIGEPGVGKTARGRGSRAAERASPRPQLRGKTLIPPGPRVHGGGAKYRGEFEERLRPSWTILKSPRARSSRSCMDTVARVRARRGLDGRGTALKPMPARGELRRSAPPRWTRSARTSRRTLPERRFQQVYACSSARTPRPSLARALGVLRGAPQGGHPADSAPVARRAAVQRYIPSLSCRTRP